MIDFYGDVFLGRFSGMCGRGQHSGGGFFGRPSKEKDGALVG
jgi:hypothetical protein